MFKTTLTKNSRSTFELRK